MKKLFLFFFVTMVCSVTYAQKTEFRFQDTQARLCDAMSNAYVQPLVCKLQVKDGKRKTHHIELSATEVEVDMKGDLANIRSYAVYDMAKTFECDVIVAATFHVYTMTTRPGYYAVDVVGFPADFTDWHTATPTDYEWIKMEKVQTTSEREKIAAVVKK